MPDVIELFCDGDRTGHIAFNQGEARISFELPQILTRSGNEVVERDHAIAAFYETVAKMRADESGRAGYEMMHGPF